jgi:polysaccharide export outer membrane protein
MTSAVVIAGVWIAVVAGLAVAQTQPPPSSPAIIAPPAGAVPPATPGPVDSAKGDKAKPPSAKPPLKDVAGVGPAYVIGPEDVLYIRVWQNQELSGSVSVGPDGMISLQLIDEVKAAGLTPHELEKDLVKRFTQFIKEPEVNVQVLKVNSRTYIIQGDGVNRPGIYSLTRPMNVMEALLAGGGFSTFANKKKIYILRGTQKFKFNWVDVSKGKNLDQNIMIQNGDQIYVN